MTSGVPKDTTPKKVTCNHCAQDFEYVGRTGRKFCSKRCSKAAMIAANPEHFRDYHRAYDASWVHGETRQVWLKANADEIKAYKRAHYQANKAKYIDAAKASAAANPEARKATLRKYNHSENGRAVQLAGVHRRLARIKGGGGSHTAEEWTALRESYGNICLCCKQTFAPEDLTRDHVVAISKGGSNDIGNLQPLCMPCNKSKHNKTIDYRPPEGRVAP